MQKMISLTDHPFDGLSLHPGDVFYAGHQFVDFLVVTGCARVATASDDAAVDAAPPAAATTPTGKRTSNRKGA